MMAEPETLLPENATSLMRALEGAAAGRYTLTDGESVRRVWSAEKCPGHLLHYLAYALSVDIWDDDWPELKKRSVIASSIRDHRLKGTLAGTRRYLEIAGADLIQTVTPPQEFFATPEMTKVEWDAHLERHPKVRIPLATTSGEWAPPEGIFADEAFSGEDSVSIDDGRMLRGRRAYLVTDGEAQPLQYEVLTPEVEVRAGVEQHRVTTPGRAVALSFADEFFPGTSFADAWDVPPRRYTYAVDRSYLHETSTLALTAVPVGFLPRDTRHVRESEAGDGSLHHFADQDFAGQGCAGPNDGGDLLADVIRLFDPAVAAPTVAGMSFADHARVDMPHHHAEMLINWRRAYRDNSAFLSDTSFAGEDPAAPNDTRRRGFLLDAVAASKRGSDRIGVTFKTTRMRMLGDGIALDRPTRLDDTSLPNTL